MARNGDLRAFFALKVHFPDNLVKKPTFGQNPEKHKEIPQYSNLAEILQVQISACSSACHNLFYALPGFFFGHRVKKKPGRASKILGNITVGADIGACKISAKSVHLVTSCVKVQ